MKHLTVEQLENLGFERQRVYKHDNYVTYIHQKGVLQIETTHTDIGQFETQDVSLTENYIDVELCVEDLLHLDRILNKTT